MSQASFPSPDAPAPLAADNPQLTYAPAPSRRGRRIRRIVLTILLLSIFAVGFIWRAPLWSHAQVIWWQHAATTFTLPDDTVVATNSRSAAVPKMPDAWLCYESLAPAPLPGGGNLTKTIAFLHARQSPAGHRRIVAIRCIPTYLASASVLQSLQPIVVEPARLWDLQSRPRFMPGPNHGGYPVFTPINLYAGQIDPENDSHFTLAYTLNGKPGTIDGWLGDDDTVKLEVRPGSATLFGERHPSTRPADGR